MPSDPCPLLSLVFADTLILEPATKRILQLATYSRHHKLPEQEKRLF